jgi:hypothetical protein
MSLLLKNKQNKGKRTKKKQTKNKNKKPPPKKENYLPSLTYFATQLIFGVVR